MLNTLAALRRLALFLLPLVCIVACGAGGGSGENAESESAALTASDPAKINIGFGGAALETGDPFQFKAIAEFFSVSPDNGPKLCHRYLRWDIALDSEGEAKDETSRKNWEDWLEGQKPKATGKVKNPCEEVLISFKGSSYYTKKGSTKTLHKGPDPKGPGDNIDACPRCFGSAFRKFLEKYAAEWAAQDAVTKSPVGTHVFAFTAWNEPNNGALDGDGRGERLSAETAAEYYLVAKKICNEGQYKCKVAAGDMASNFHMVDDFHHHCAADIGADVCKDATWLDSYKASIVKHAKDYGFTDKFRPETWAYHAWQEVNDFIYGVNDDPCRLDKNTKTKTDDRCATNLLTESLQGSWKTYDLWDTEVGVGQKPKKTVSYEEQAKGAGYLMRLSANAGVSRIYYQGVETGPWRITCGGKARPAYCVLANRSTDFPSNACTTNKCSAIEDVELDDEEREELATLCPPGMHSTGNAANIDSFVDGGGGGLISDDAGSVLPCVNDTAVVSSGSGSEVESDAGSPLVGGGGLVK
jgi:hypothetical protein